MIKINKQWAIEHHKHGGFNLIETKQGKGKKGQPIETTRSYFYPNLELCAKKMVECGFDNDAHDLLSVAGLMADYVSDIVEALNGVNDGKS